MSDKLGAPMRIARPFFASAMVLAAATASAQENAADRAAARELGVDGVMLADKGKCDAAIEKLEKAEKLYHAPTTLERLAECQIETGKIVDGTENLQRVVREPLPEKAPAPFKAAKQRAEAALKKALPRIAKLRISVAAPPGAKLAVTVDQQALSDAALDNDRPTDPGTHAVEATAPGYLKAAAVVTLKEGDSQSVTLKLEPDPSAPKTPPPAASASDGPAGAAGPDDRGASPARGEPPSHAGAYVALGVGAVGVGVGAVTGLLALTKKSDLDKACGSSKACPTASQSEIDSAKSLGTISTVAFIVGGAAAVTGVVLFATGGSAKASATTAKGVRPVVGPGYAGLAGRF